MEIPGIFDVAEVDDVLSEPRRTLHRRAVEVLERQERDGTPFTLLLRTYEVAQLFGDNTGRLLGNIVFEALEPAGVGVLDVQLHEHPHGPLLYTQEGFIASTVRWPSLLLDETQWEQAVSQIIVRAELIVVLAPLMTPGLAWELEALVRLSRTDRTVVLVSGEDLGGPEDRSVAILKGDEVPDTSETMFDPVLLQFPRVLWVGDLDQETPLSAFVFRDLVDRVIAIGQLPDKEGQTASPDRDEVASIDPTPMLGEYESLAFHHRARNRSDVAALYYGIAARLALDVPDLARAVDHSLAQADLLTEFGKPGVAFDSLTDIYVAFDEWMRARVRDYPDLVCLHATLVAERARMLTHAGNLVGAESLIDEEATLCGSPFNGRALSRLMTMRAWNLRTGSDPDAVMAAGTEAFQLARAAGAEGEMGRALTVLGATLHDLGDLVQAESFLVHASGFAPPDRAPDRAHQDHWRLLVRLGEVLQAQHRDHDAATVFQQAITAAETGGYGWCADLARDRLSKAQ